MKYCTHCGTEILDEAVICVKCGCRAEHEKAALVPVQENDTLDIIIKIFLIIGCISQGWMLIPLAWCIPITVSIFHAMRDKRPIGTGIKVCALIFVNLVAGICLLCKADKDNI